MEQPNVPRTFESNLLNLMFSILPKQVVIHMVYYVVRVLNCHVTKLSISDIFAPRELVLRRKLDWFKHCTNKGKAL